MVVGDSFQHSDESEFALCMPDNYSLLASRFKQRNPHQEAIL